MAITISMDCYNSIMGYQFGNPPARSETPQDLFFIFDGDFATGNPCPFSFGNIFHFYSSGFDPGLASWLFFYHINNIHPPGVFVKLYFYLFCIIYTHIVYIMNI